MARIKIDLERTVGDVSPLIFGGFIEHLGRCIYGGVYDEGSPLSDANGYRRDVLAALRELRVPVLRWPGGNFVSGYHWLDGVGPVAERPRRIELAWFAEESNRFGTIEFLEYCRLLGAEPYIVVNMGTGTLDEAQSWVEYCNGTGNTSWAQLRRAHGHPEPFKVKYWGLGNEMYGSWQIGGLSAEDYVKRARQFANVMKWTDPTIKLVGCGENGWQSWDRIVLEGLAPLIDYYSIHLYTGSDDYYSNVFTPHQAERALRYCQALIDQVRYTQGIAHPIRIAYDEWNVWYRARTYDTGLEERYNLADAIAFATYLNIFIRHCQTVGMANVSQLVNVVAPIFTSPDGLFRQTTYHPLQLYAAHTQAVALAPLVECPTHDLTGSEDTERLRGFAVADLGPFPMLDVAVTRDPAGRRLTLAVVNRDRDQAHPTTIAFEPGVTVTGGQAYLVQGASPAAANAFGTPDAVGVTERSVAGAGRELSVEFPAHSITVLTLSLGTADSG